MRVHDISVTVKPGMTTFPGDPRIRRRLAKTLARDGVNLSEYCLGAHTGTHVDAPRHFLRGGAGIDRLDVGRFIGPVWVADLRAVTKGIDPAALQAARIPRGARRVLLRTSNSRLWRQARFERRFVYLAPEGADWLIERGVQLVGIDYLSVEEFGRPGAPTHKRLLSAGVPILEGLDLQAVGPGAYQLAALPVRWQNADGAPTRAVLYR
jgi:arylformamidase